MAKFRIRMKLQAFELEVEGTRDDLPVLRDAMSQQFAGLLGPATALADGEAPPIPHAATVIVSEPAGARKTTGKRPRAAARNGGISPKSSEPTGAFDWKHDTSRYASPLQSWNTTQKSLYVLYVSSSESVAREMSAGQIAKTFNKHFRQAGQIRPSHISRDLGKLKSGGKGEPPQVGEDTTRSPSMWFLTDAGSKAAQNLVTLALGGQTAATPVNT